ncbi:MAG TPA: hypothetical protein VNN79_00125 [Actinomycetota bacterium]|nr:hypothetical protein [Actinomycetota bacterium]
MPMWGINPSNGTAVYNGATYSGEWFDSTPPNLILNRRYRREAFVLERPVRSHHAFSGWIGGWRNPRHATVPYRRGIRPIGDVFGGTSTILRPPTG